MKIQHFHFNTHLLNTPLSEFHSRRWLIVNFCSDRLYRKFNAKNRKELIQKAIKLNFLGYKDISYKFRKRFLKKDINISSKINVPDNIEPLNESEMKIFNLAIKGYTKKEIVRELNLLNMHSCNVSFYIILRKLKAENITNAVCIAIKSGLIKI